MQHKQPSLDNWTYERWTVADVDLQKLESMKDVGVVK